MKQKITTIINPSLNIFEKVTLTNSEQNFLKSYVIPTNKIFVFEKSLQTTLPADPNIGILDQTLKKVKSKMQNAKVLSTYNHHGEISEDRYIDGSGQQFAKKTTTPEGTTYELRGDIAHHIALFENKTLIQCNRSVCNGLFPRSLNVNLKNFQMVKGDEK